MKTRELLPLSEVIPDREYAAAVACRYIPGTFPGRHLNMQALVERIKNGAVEGVVRPAGRYQRWFVTGAEVIRQATGKRHVPRDRATAEEIVSPLEFERRQRAAQAFLESKGCG